MMMTTRMRKMTTTTLEKKMMMTTSTRMTLVLCSVATVLSTVVAVSEALIDLKFIDEFIHVNNALRRLPNATNMRRMKWNKELAKMAAEAAESCQLELGQIKHEKYRSIGVATHVMRDTEPDLTLALLTWYSEGFHYDDPSRKCRQDSCHVYTHVMRAQSARVGCGYQMCPFGEVIKGGRERRAYVVCYYGNSEYKDGVEVFQNGIQCSACPSGLQCVDELCVRLKKKMD